MPEVKKPRVLRLKDRRWKAVVDGDGDAVIELGLRCDGIWVNPVEARHLARWLNDYAAWAASLDQAEEKARAERDEKNE